MKSQQYIQYLKNEGYREDYSPSASNKKALAPSLNFCGSAASTVMLGRSIHNLVIVAFSLIDNATIVAYINRQGGTKSLSLCMIAEQILAWMVLNSIELINRFIPGRRNVMAHHLDVRVK